MSVSILVVENDPMSRELARRVLSAGGYRVTCVNDAEEAIVRVSKIKPALVLMDVRLPGMDGFEATRRLRANPATKGIAVAMLSAQAFAEDARLAEEAGCVDFLTKPIGARELLDRVDAIVSRPGAKSKGKKAPK